MMTRQKHMEQGEEMLRLAKDVTFRPERCEAMVAIAKAHFLAAAVLANGSTREMMIVDGVFEQ